METNRSHSYQKIAQDELFVPSCAYSRVDPISNGSGSDELGQGISDKDASDLIASEGTIDASETAAASSETASAPSERPALTLVDYFEDCWD